MCLRFIFSGLTHNYVYFFVLFEVNTSSVAAFYAQFSVRVKSPTRHYLSLFLHTKALICHLNKLMYFPVDES